MVSQSTEFFLVVLGFRYFLFQYVGPGGLKISSISSLQDNIYWKSSRLSYRGTTGAGAIQFSKEQGGKLGAGSWK